VSFAAYDRLGSGRLLTARLPEPELMTGERQARAYALADLSGLQASMVSHFEERFPSFQGSRLLDLGCGAADMSIRFAKRYPDIRAVGVDGSEAMLRFGREAVRRAGLDDRIALEHRHLPDAALDREQFDAVIANSVLHHLADPAVLWRTACRSARQGAPVMVMDLRRPSDTEAAQQLVDRHGAEAPAILRRDFFLSLCAAYTIDEIRDQLARAGLSRFRAEEVGDLHILIWGRSR
jgi:cyclopropane fatty-acyl-phospholipid synthase-like methyltransferase